MKSYLLPSLGIALLLSCAPAFSQSQTTGFSINPKGGIFLCPDEENGAVLGVEANYLRNGWLFSIDFFHLEEIGYSLAIEDIYQQVGLMAGKYYGEKLFRIELQGGIAALWEVGESDPSEPGIATAGLVLKTGFKFIPLHFLSIGLDLQGNINSKKTLFMPLISIEIGRLRDKID
ncbi:MAG: hypothetical protein P1P83_13015 [Bacteroidales bacterium]|nr:hypothetical protein [Bacteroidales bacterium]MDT8372354.1 hypothetical protein [Bacteroidales bacterium]